MPTIEVRFETLDDSGCTVFTLFEADLPSLGIGPGSQAYQNRSVVNTANGQVYRDVVRLKLVWKDPGTDAHICYVFEEDCNVMPGAWNPALGRNRLSGLSLRRKAYMATAPVEPVVLNVAETRHGVFKNIPT
ncbi:hypothetical protein BJ508DRAFT_335207 [Ascobolus immersus RN42]|uniref:Uncharacterized protein n=1 Tax=Ascobolus immersus RN42 TaxID=1160509 RepID=A0A3N4HD74_ASCIM|nr:hypothetical protein BJ508DRAFT_335207 [Ascobolus immersus RN42]